MIPKVLEKTKILDCNEKVFPKENIHLEGVQPHLGNHTLPNVPSFVILLVSYYSLLSLITPKFKRREKIANISIWIGYYIVCIQHSAALRSLNLRILSSVVNNPLLTRGKHTLP